MRKLSSDNRKPTASPHFQRELPRSAARAGHPFAVVKRCNRIVLMTQGHSGPSWSKTATQMLRYRQQDIVAILDQENAGLVAEDLFGIGGKIPVVGSLAEAADANAVFIGIAPPGGCVPGAWLGILADALEQGLHLVSGLHTPLANHPDLVRACSRGGGVITDLRRQDLYLNQVGRGLSFPHNCTRVLTVGTDCSVGKMSAAKEIEIKLRAQGRDVAFLATGQTGVMISGEGVVIDAVISDFANGAAEQLVVANQHHDYLLIEGQGSIVHPAYSGISTALLHGSAPHGMILCHEVNREFLKSEPKTRLWPLASLRKHYETVASARYPSQVIGIALNTRGLTGPEAEATCRAVELETGLPTCDVYRDGPDKLANAVVRLKSSLRGKQEVAKMKEIA